ncbi:MAG: MSCRAMM family adhesin SdrC [Pirellula sp.]|nr:MSCRAMM family adhesin SdrC [Pirellula sp.]
MLETIRKYWIGGLVLVMVGLHASIVGLIRHQASQAKVDISCEVDLGAYLAYPNENNTPVSMRLHAIVPLNHRVKSRQLIELNQAQIRQAIEEHIRQIDHRVLRDPYLSDLRTQLLDVLVQTIGSTAVEDLAITELQKTNSEFALSFTNASHPRRPKMVATLRSEVEANASDEHGHSDAEHDSHGDDGHGGDGHGTEDHAAGEHSDGHSDGHADGHSADKSDAADSHGATSDKSHDSHDTSSHGSDGGSDHSGGKSGHGDAKGHGKPKAKAAVKYTPGMGKKKKEDAGGHGGGH